MLSEEKERLQISLDGMFQEFLEGFALQSRSSSFPYKSLY